MHILQGNNHTSEMGLKVFCKYFGIVKISELLDKAWKEQSCFQISDTHSQSLSLQKHSTCQKLDILKETPFQGRLATFDTLITYVKLYIN